MEGRGGSRARARWLGWNLAVGLCARRSYGSQSSNRHRRHGRERKKKKREEKERKRKEKGKADVVRLARGYTVTFHLPLLLSAFSV